MYQFRIRPGEADEIVLTPDSISNVDFAKTHSGMSDFTLTTAYDTSLENEVLEEIYLEFDPNGANELLFRGTLLGVESDEDRISTTLKGNGVAYRLTNDETIFSASNELAHDAIERFWNNETSFSPTVTAPTATSTTTSEQAQEANTNSEFNNLVEIPDDNPVVVQNDNLELAQSSWTQEGENWSSTTNGVTEPNGGYSGGSAAIMGTANPQVYEYNFTIDHTIPAEDFTVGVRFYSTTGNGNVPPDVSWYLDGERISGYAPVTSSIQWQPDIISNSGTGSQPSSDLEPGQHTLRFELDAQNTESWYLDVVQPYDTGDRFGGWNYTYDNTNDGSGGYLDGPELYPDSFTFALNEESSSWNITDGSLSTTWNDTTNNQSIQIRLGGQTWLPNDGTENNTTSVSTDFGTDVGSIIQGRVTFSRYGSRSTATPQTGFNGQNLQSWDLTFDGDNTPVFGDQTFEGSLFQIAQDLHNAAKMRFTFQHERNSLPVESFRVDEVTKSLPALDVQNKVQRVDYANFANHITVRGQTVDDNRLSHTASDTTSINDIGKVHFDKIDPNLKSIEAVKVNARNTLQEKLQESTKKGTLSVSPTDVLPGPSYPNQFDSSGDDLPLEEVQYTAGRGELTGQLVFDLRRPDLGIAEDIGGIRRDSRNTRLGF